MAAAVLLAAVGSVASSSPPLVSIRRNSIETRYTAGSSPILLSTTSAPLRPSSTIRVGATSRSPIPASAEDESAMSGAATAAAAKIDLVQNVMSAIPTLLHSGAIASPLIHNG